MPRVSLASLALLALIPGIASAQPSRNVTLLAHLNQHTAYSACWSYVHHDGREYAILGATDGTSIVNVTVPQASYEVAFIPGLQSKWREMKQYRDYVYVSTEAGGGGIQIINMADPEHPGLLRTYTTVFDHEHTLEVDTTRAFLFCNGTRLNSMQTGMRILSLADPVNPVDLGGYTDDYVHDCFPRGDTLFASCIVSHTMRVLDIHNPAAITEVTNWTYPKATTHSAETSKDGKYLYVCDETNYGTMKVFDIHDLMAHPEIMEITVNPLAIVHNVHVKEDTAFVAYYTEGVRLFDISDPALPAQFGFYDTYPGFSGGFHGVWELAPRFPSGTFIASDISTGLYVFRANPNYGVLKLKVVNETSTPVDGADVTSVGESDSTQTQAFGLARLCLSPGSHTLRVSKFGMRTATLPVTTTKGTHDSVLVELATEPIANVTGVVRTAVDSLALEDSDIEMIGTPLETSTTAGGAYTVRGVPGQTYRMICDRPGYVPIERLVTVDPGVDHNENFFLKKAAWYDSCDTDKGWSLSDPSDNAITGMWERAVPVGTWEGSARPAGRAPLTSRVGVPHPAAQHDVPAEGVLAEGPVQPGQDHSPGHNGFCFVTGNGIPGRPPGDDDVDGGKTTLTTPPLDMSGIGDPYIHFARWYYMSSPGDPDSFLIDISPDGVTWVKVRRLLRSEPAWVDETFRVRDYITPSAGVRVRFIAQDQPPEGVVEAAIDDFEFYGSGAPADSLPGPSPRFMTLSLPVPNPARHATSIGLSLPVPGRARVAVYDLAGREVRVLYDKYAPAPAVIRWDGRDARGKAAPSGVYWIRAEAAGRKLERKLVWVR